MLQGTGMNAKNYDRMNILIYRIGHLGDTICAIPALIAIRKRFPRSRILLLTNRETGQNYDPADLLEKTGFVDKIIQYEIAKAHNPRYFLGLAAELSRLKASLFIYLYPSHASVARLLRDYLFFKAVLRCGMVGFDIRAPLAVTFAKMVKRGHFPKEVNRLMGLLKPIGIAPHDIEYALPITAEEMARVDALWTKFSLDKGQVVVLAPAGKYPATQWPITSYLNLSEKLQSEFHAKVILLGGPQERAKLELFDKSKLKNLIVLIHQTSVMESAEIIRRSALLIANDCSIIHLGAAVNTPAIGLYSSKDFPERWHPYGDQHTVLRNDSLPCRYCFNEKCAENICLKSITVEQVISACKRYLKASC